MLTQRCRRRDRAGFTMIELLTVIGIIIILMGILIPVVSAVRRKGFEADTSHEINNLANACNNYFQDFHAYPGPLPDAINGAAVIHGFGLTINGSPVGTPDSGTPSGALNLIVTATPAPGTQPAAITQTLLDITSGQNMLLGLLGGISQIPGATTAPLYQFDVTLVNKGPSSLNPVAMQHYPAYYEPTKYELSNDGVGDLVSAAPLGYVANGVNYPSPCVHADFLVPDFLDHFPTPLPIVYLRAIPGATYVCDIPATKTTTGMSNGSQYYSGELTPYCPNFFNQIDPASLLTTPLYPFATAAGGQQAGQNFFQNQSIQDQYTPRSKDTFILMSAGFDGLYGTKDDIVYSN